MEVKIKKPVEDIEKYLEYIGIVNIKKRTVNTFCHLVCVDGKTQIFHFKEIMQLIEQLYKDEFLDLYVTKFDGLLQENEKSTYFKYEPRSEFLRNYINDYSFKGKLRGLRIEDYSPFINDLFLDINMGVDRGVQTKCFEEIEIHIYDYLDKLEADGSNVFFKADMIDYVNEKYNTVAPLSFDDEIHKKRYLKILEDEGIVDVVGKYDRDIPEFILKFLNKHTGEWRVDENSKFLNLNTDEEYNKDEFNSRRYTSTPKRYLVRTNEN